MLWLGNKRCTSQKLFCLQHVGLEYGAWGLFEVAVTKVKIINPEILDSCARKLDATISQLKGIFN